MRNLVYSVADLLEKSGGGGHEEGDTEHREEREREAERIAGRV